MATRELTVGQVAIPVLREDRAVLALDKPYGWMLAPETWRHTGRNLQTALQEAIARREYWCVSRRIGFLRYIHRLDAETTGVLLFGKTKGAVRAYSALFQQRCVEKVYLAIVTGRPREAGWECSLRLNQDPGSPGRVRAQSSGGEEALTRFKVLAAQGDEALIEARPITGRTHQIRVHLAESGYPIIGDALYSDSKRMRSERRLALRSVALGYRDPFTGQRIAIRAPVEEFLSSNGFQGVAWPRGGKPGEGSGV